MKKNENVNDINLRKNINRTPVLGGMLSKLQNSRIGENKALLRATNDFKQDKINALHDITELKNMIKVRKLQIETIEEKNDKLKFFLSHSKDNADQE